jgi:hypothetical protein
MPGEWIVKKEGRKARVFTRALQKAAPQTRPAVVRRGNGPAKPLTFYQNKYQVLQF